MRGFQRHLERCNSGRDAADRVEFRLGGAAVGSLTAADAEAVAAMPGWRHYGAALVADASALREAAAALGAAGRMRLRGEEFDVRAAADGPVLARLDRGAVPVFGVIGHGVHLNGLVRDGGGLRVWVGIRARNKPTAPGQLDHLVAGGIPAGHDRWSTLVKEADEEASLPAALVAGARPVGQIAYVMRLDGGLRRDVLHCYDVELPPDFEPRPNDDEVERFELWPAVRLMEAVRDGDDVKFNVNLVLIDLFLREGLIDPNSAEGRALRAGLVRGL